jgi:pyruvate/2-oxoglutarate dehydrogenase complex dihydrolipoamide dehydrogenase (E3) component
MNFDYDLAVIGGGTAGLVAAFLGKSMGAKTVLIERERIGGECLWTGCVPSKTLIKSAKVFDLVSRAEEFGVHVEGTRLIWRALQLRIAAVRDEIKDNERKEIARIGLETLRGDARFIDGQTLTVRTAEGETTIRARKIILAAGTRPRLPEIEGLPETEFITHEKIYDLPSMPRSLVIIGGGPIACEFGQAFARFGSKVTVLQRGNQLLEKEDTDVAEAALKILTTSGAKGHLGVQVMAVGTDDKGKWVRIQKTNGEVEEIRASQILVATGKVCDLTAMNVEAGGIKWSDKGVEVDAHLKAAPTVWACGDVTGGPFFTHRSEYQGRIAAQNALLPVKAKANDAPIPRVTYMDPEIAAVGAAEADLKAGEYEVYKIPFSGLDRAIIEGETMGFAKFLCAPSGRILGAHLVGPNAGELISLCTSAVREGALIQEWAEMIFAYPTLSEILHRAGQQSYQKLLDAPLVQRTLPHLVHKV